MEKGTNLSAPNKAPLRELLVYTMLGTLTFALQVALEFFPNIHLTGMFVMVFTLAFRKKALIPIYLYVFLVGIRWGFGISWIPYLYLWVLLWGITMLLPQRMPKKVAVIVYPALCGFFGLVFGCLYAPAQALLFGFNKAQTVAWIVSGFPYDLLHAAGNLCAGTLIFPLSELMRKLKGIYL